MALSPSYYYVLAVDLLFNALLVFLFGRGQLRKTWKWMYTFLMMRLVFGLSMQGLILLQSHLTPHEFARAYFVVYYFGFLALLAATYALYVEVFRRVMVPFPGFARHARKLGYLASAAILILMFTSIGSPNPGTDWLARTGFALARATGTVDLCIAALLSFLAYSLVSMKSKTFGIIFGFFISGFGDMLQVIAFQLHLNTSSSVFTLSEATNVIAAGIWITYAFLPEPLPRPVTFPADSPVYRWSQIAGALGTKAQVTMPAQQPSFFLADVEKVVDKVFSRHMQETPENRG